MKESPLPLARNLVPFVSYMMLSGGSGYGFFAFAPQLLEMHVNEGLVSLILLFQPAMIMGFSTLFGRISDKHRNRKKLVFLGILVKLLAYAIFQVAVNAPPVELIAKISIFILVYILIGFSIAICACESAWFSDFTLKGHQEQHARGKQTGVSYYFLVSSISWAVGSILVGWLIRPRMLGNENLPVISLVILAGSLVPLAFIKDTFSSTPRPSCSIEFQMVQDLEDLAHGKVVYAAIAMRHFGLITTLSLLSIVLADLGVESGFAGIIISLNPILQIVGMFTGVILVGKVKPLKLFAFGILLSAIVISCYTLGDSFQVPGLLATGQACLGFAWSFLIIGFEEYIIRNVDWNKRANYVGYRQFFMNAGKVLGQLTYFISFVLLGWARLQIFLLLLGFPACAFFLVLGIIVKHRDHPGRSW